MHTETASYKRARVLLGMKEPELTWSVPMNNIRQCGFGLDAKDERRFVIIEKNETVHSFSSVYARHLEKVMTALNWKRMQAGELVYSIR